MKTFCRILAFPFLVVGEVCFWIAHSILGEDDWEF